MCLHVLDDHVVQSFVFSAAGVDTAPEQEPLKVLEDQHADEGHSEDHHNEDHVKQHEHDRKHLVRNRVRHQVVARETDNDQYQGYDQLVERDTHIFEPLHLDSDFVFGSPV